jgi:hypothetical protein
MAGGLASSPLMALCRCDHTQRRHEEETGPCKAGGCGCGSFRRGGTLEPVVPVAGAPVAAAPMAAQERSTAAAFAKAVTEAPSRSVFPVGEQGPELQTVPLTTRPVEPCLSATHPHGDPGEVLGTPGVLEQLIERGQVSSVKRTRQLAERVLADVVQLRRVLEEEAVADEARAEIERLEAQLAAARARLRTAVPRAAGGAARANTGGTGGVTYGTYPCPHEGCDVVKTSAQGLGGHRFRAHGYRKADAS